MSPQALETCTEQKEPPGSQSSHSLEHLLCPVPLDVRLVVPMQEAVMQVPPHGNSSLFACGAEGPQANDGSGSRALAAMLPSLLG